MTVAEFSEELDVIYENINKNGAPGLDEYEKSVILTHAQENVVRAILKIEPSGSRLPELITVTSDSSVSVGVFDDGYVFAAPQGILQILNEYVVDSSGNRYTVLPITNEQYQIKKSKPYQHPPRRRAWRLEFSSDGIDSKAEIFTRPSVAPTEYFVRYVKKPGPIILVDLTTLVPSTSTIDGLTAVTECRLDSGLHREVLKGAAVLAEQYYYDKYGSDGNK